MCRLAASLFSKVWVAKKSIWPVVSRLSWSRNYSLGSVEISCRNKLPKDCHVIEECSATIGDIAKYEKNPYANFTCEMLEEGFWLSFLYRGGDCGMGSDSRGIKYRPILSYALKDALVDKGLKALEEGDRDLYIIDDIKNAVWAVRQYLSRIARPVKGYEELFQVATTAANGDKEIGELVAKAIEKVGKDGLFAVYGKKRLKNRLEFVKAMKINWGAVSSSLITDDCFENIDDDFENIVLKNPFILIHEKKILKEDVVKQAMRLRRPLLIVAEDVDIDLVRSLRLDQSCCGTKFCVVKPPKCENNGKAIMQDLAVLTGGQVVTSESEMDFIPQMLGSCQKITVSRDTMAILGGSGGQEDIEERRKQLISLISSGTWNSNHELKLLEERLAKLSFEAAVFKIGGASEAEVDKFYCRVANAVNAAVAALKSGIVASRGVALLHASKELDKWYTAGFNSWGTKCGRNKNSGNNRKRLGVRLVQNALKVPVAAIAYAAGFDYSVVVEKLLEVDNPDLGYDPAKGEYTDLIKSGIVDPVRFLSNELDDLDWDCTGTFVYRNLDLKSIKDRALAAEEEETQWIL